MWNYTIKINRNSSCNCCRSFLPNQKGISFNSWKTHVENWLGNRQQSWINFIISGNLTLFIKNVLFILFDRSRWRAAINSCDSILAFSSEPLDFEFHCSRSSPLQPSSCWLLLFYFRWLASSAFTRNVIVSFPISGEQCSRSAYVWNWIADLEEVECNHSRISSISGRIHRFFIQSPSENASVPLSHIAYTTRLYTNCSPVLLFASNNKTCWLHLCDSRANY